MPRDEQFTGFGTTDQPLFFRWRSAFVNDNWLV